jgi:hypothetical protein
MAYSGLYAEDEVGRNMIDAKRFETDLFVYSITNNSTALFKRYGNSNLHPKSKEYDGSACAYCILCLT